ncbi:MAG: 50S ribosomal protein L10 [Cyclobacteriaceae bacterium]|nr:50S ribosomal protein L10 [Cyclobacteriaceae bacterium]
MTREDKVKVLEELSEKFSKKPNFYVTDASGLTVAEINKFRRLCFEKGVEYKVYKNTLIQKALEKLDVDYTEFFTALKGFSGIMFSEEDGANVPAKVLKEFRKGKAEKPMLKAASLESEFYFGDENVKMLSELKSKNELIGEIIGLLQSPAKNVVSALQSGKSTLAGLVKTLSEREN